MADVEISYKGNEIATMSATGVKTLLTGDTFCEDDITIAYTKSGGGVQTTHISGSQTIGYWAYTDADGVAQTIALSPFTQLNADVISKSLVVGYSKATSPTIETPTNTTLVTTISVNTSGTYKQVRIFQAN